MTTHHTARKVAQRLYAKHGWKQGLHKAETKYLAANFCAQSRPKDTKYATKARYWLDVSFTIPLLSRPPKREARAQ